MFVSIKVLVAHRKKCQQYINQYFLFTTVNVTMFLAELMNRVFYCLRLTAYVLLCAT